MKTKLLFTFLLLSTLTLAQAPGWTWANRIGGPNTEGNGGGGYDGGHTCASDAEGNCYVTGYFASGTLILGPDTLHTNGIHDVFVAKFDSMGTALWARSAGGSAYDQAYGIAVDTAGNVYVTGSYQSQFITFGTVTLANSSSSNWQDIFLVKYDPNGNVLWAKTAGNVGVNDFAKSVTVDPSGNSYITGNFGGTSIVFGSYTLTNNFFITKYDPNGNVVWANGTVSMGPNVYSNSIDGNENVYITGVFFSSTLIFGTDTLLNDTTSGSADIFVVKYDSSGTVLWAKRAGGNRPDMAYCIYADSVGNAFVTGCSYSPSFNFGSSMFVNFDNSGGTHDFYMLKFDSSGNELWLQDAGSTNADQGLSITTDYAGNIYATGSFTSSGILFGSTLLTNSATLYSEVFIVKYDSSGNAVWAKRLAGNGNDYGRSIATNQLGDVYASGEFASSSLSFGSSTILNSGFPYSDMYYAKIGHLNLTTTVADKVDAEETVLYPNPGNGIFFLKSDQAISKIEIMNVLGEKIADVPVSDRNQQIDLSKYPAGIYFYRATRVEKSYETGKIIIQ